MQDTLRNRGQGSKSDDDKNQKEEAETGVVPYICRLLSAYFGPDIRSKLRSVFVNLAVFGALAAFLYFAVQNVQQAAIVTDEA